MTEFSFHLRNRVFGQLRLRGQLPAPDRGARFSKERQFYELMLARALAQTEVAASKIETVYDVGCRNWSYVSALATAFSQAQLIGVEVDGGRRYWNLHRRIDQAAANARALVGSRTQVVHDDFRNLELAESAGRAAAICFFFPFVSERPCRKWGVPGRFADFGSLLTHALTGPSAALVVVSLHQGEWEAEIARAAYGRAGLVARESIVKAVEFQGLWPSSHDAHLFVGTPLAARR